MMLARVRAVIRHLEREGRRSANDAPDGVTVDAVTALGSTLEAVVVSPMPRKRAGDAFWTALQEIDLNGSPAASTAALADVRDRDSTRR
jgi:hypothetical protein